MASTNEGDDQERFRRHVRSADFETIRVIAETMRAEFGGAIDAHPGGVGSEAGVVNRAFRMAAWVILKKAGSLDDEPAVRTWALRQVALGRLCDHGLSGPPAEVLLDLEPGLGDAWLAYMALSPATVIGDLIRERRRDATD